MLRVYSDYYYRSYKAPYISFGSFCCLAAAVLTLLIPFLLLYFTGPPFWNYNALAYEQPKVSFTNEEFVRSPHSEISLDGKSSEDPNDDGRNDVLSIEVTVPAPNGDIGGTQVDFAIGLRYEIEDIARVAMNTALFFTLNVPKGASEIKVEGDLILNQRTPVYPSYKQRELYGNEGIFQALQTSYLEAFELCYSRNHTLQYDFTQTATVSSGNSVPVSTTVEIKIRIPPLQAILYQQGLFEVLKQAWVQYMGLFVPVYILTYYGFMWFAYRMNALEGQPSHEGTLRGREKLKQY